ncbi:hypothetical protein M7I_2806 [Glarea lozoyensis 74030]|uniref:C2H2-type domain-containing protein n=1 Tax=Glarea lozoyensis (strain ATCC 74030 / MF5533) TaxID=1104152 RepID=H0EJS6_GLAL7|nr:hypothetical protein M7I_2806 [Glarea lozoyensis 74030]
MASLMVPPGYRPVPLDRCPPEVRAIIFKEVLKATKPMEEALRIQGNRNTDGVAPSHEENGSDEDQGSDKEGSVVWDDPLNTEEIIREFTSADRHKEKGESLRLQLEWIDCNGGSRILNSELLHINRATTTEVLSWLLPLTLFKAWTPMELERLGRRMTIQIGIMRAGKSPTWNVEVEMGTHAGIDNHWKTCEGAHGADGFVLEVFEEWMHGVNLARFTDIIVNHISGREIDSPAPLQRTLKAGIRVLISSLTFDYPKFALTRNERARLDAVFDTLADEGKLVRGRARKELHWVGTYLVEKMVRAWFQNAIDNGYRSWDIVVHKALSVVLQSALACRAGEICRSKGYETEYMQWSDIVMTLPPGWTTIDDVQVSCLLRYEKNQKREKNTYREVPLTVLRAPELNIICAVKLLLIQALRSGNILSLDHAFDQASRRVDNTVQWIFPNRPVIPSLHISSGFILWDSSNGTNSLNQTTKELGLNAGILADIRSHDIRRGAFRDLATIKRAPDAPPLGVASTEVAVIGGHSIKSLQSGVTDAYVGGVEHESYSSRAEQLPVSRKTAIVGKAYKRKRVQGHEIDDYCLENNLDATKGSERVKAGRRLKSSRAAAFIESERNADKTPSKSHTMSSPRLLMLPTPTASAPKPTSESPSSSVGNTLESLIDPRLTSYGNQDGVDVDVETDAAVSTLSALVYGDDEAIGEDEEILGMDILLECAARSDSSAQKSLLELDGRADRIFLTAQALEAHEMNNHRPITPPMRCTFEGCKSETLFGQWTSYTRHLKSIHGLASVKDRERYMLEEFKRHIV